VSNGLFDEVISVVDVNQRLLKVDDVDAGALSKTKALNFRVPPTSLVSEVNAAVKQLANGYDGNGRSPVLNVDAHSTHTSFAVLSQGPKVTCPSARWKARVSVFTPPTDGVSHANGHAKSPR
jgi:hypothetical protein